MSKIDIFELAKDFCEELKKQYALPGGAAPEDQLKMPVANFVNEIGKTFAIKPATTTEVPLAEKRVRPDMAVHKSKLICGYIELKAPGLGADPTKLKGKHNKEQWEKLKNLPNLIYTDGREWALYQSGKLAKGIIKFSDDPLCVGKKAASENVCEKLKDLFLIFLNWEPDVPSKPRKFAEFIAPLTRLFRDEVEQALEDPKSNVNLLAEEWRKFFLPEADNAQFADTYAQTVTYALLLARFEGIKDLSPANAAKKLDKNNGILARSLETLGHPDALEELKVSFDLLKYVMQEADVTKLQAASPDIWLYFYEDFLVAYDPKLRKNSGVYYTPSEVVEFQVRLAGELLEKRFKKKRGFADDGVVFLDPAVGTGTYPVAVVKHGLDKVRSRFGEGGVPTRASQMARNMYGFEIMMGPYAVAHLRLTQALESEGAKLKDRLNIYLTDTMESPNADPPGGLSLYYKELTNEHEAARELKNKGDILVCLGNPPYDRQHIDHGDTTTKRKGGWVRFGDKLEGGAKEEKTGIKPIFDDFLEPARKAGAGVHLHNIYNDYVYFWRWALWRMFEKQNCGGIVSFITASSYITGQAFLGMREVMRRTFDELWIIDLNGSGLSARKNPNVFNIQTPVAIAIGMRGKIASNDTPAKVHYARIDGGTREEKLKILESKKDFASIIWSDCSDEWQDSFLPIGKGKYFEWPKLTDIFPYQRSGSRLGRTWPIGPTDEVLEKRWKSMLAEDSEGRRKKFKENANRSINYNTCTDYKTGNVLTAISALNKDAPCPPIKKYAFRSFDLHQTIVDSRVNERMAEVLWLSSSDKQIYFATLTAIPFGAGPGIVASTAVPDISSFRGSFGAKDIIPLYRDAEATKPNITNGLIDKIATTLKQKITIEDFVAYIYAVLGNQSFTNNFWNELEIPGIHIPITKDKSLFNKASKLGANLIWLHTYAERFNSDSRNGDVPVGKAKTIVPISDDPTKYPEQFSYNESTKEIFVGDGNFGNIEPEIWQFEVSGLKVVQSWLGYRMKKRAGKKSSSLDDIHPERWTATMNEQFLELLWVLEATLELEPELSKVFDKIISSPCFNVSQLPMPSEEQRKAPTFSVFHNEDGTHKKLI